jgi:hypothetical protein
MPIGLTQRALAERAGIRQPSVFRAIRRGLIDLCSDGSIDPDGPRTLAWLDTHHERSIKPIDVPATRLVERSGSLREREYDLALLAANSVEREELRSRLLIEAEEWRARMRLFPAELAELLAPSLAVPVARLAEEIAAGITSFLEHRSPEVETIDRVLAGAAARWRFYPPRHMLNPPPLPDFVAPASLNEAMQRSLTAKAEMARLRVRTRAGEVLAKGAADLAAGGLRLGWIEASTSEFGAAFIPLLLSRLSIAADHGLIRACELVTHQHVARRLAPIWPGKVHGVHQTYLAEAEDTLLAHRTGLPIPAQPIATGRFLPPGFHATHLAAVAAWRKQARARVRGDRPHE